MKRGKDLWKFACFILAGSVLFSLLLTIIRTNTPHAQKKDVQKNTTTLQTNSDARTPRWKEAYAQLPLGFEENRGQAAGQVKFVSHSSGYSFALMPQEVDIAVLRRKAMTASPLHRAAALKALREARKAAKTTLIRMRLEGANPAPAIAAADQLPGKSNYFIGNKPENWITDVPAYSRVKYSGIYRGVDVDFYGNHRRLEHDFTVAPGADPKVIQLKIDGAQQLAIDSHGDLVLRIADGEMKLQKPVMYQMAGAERRDVAGKYVLRAQNRVTFAVANYDHSLPLVIDPVLSPLLSYSTYLGGTGDEMGLGIAVDSNGDAFIGGATSSTDFPPTAPSTQIPSSAAVVGCGFVAELDPTGATLKYSSYLCGTSGDDEVFGLALDPNGKLYVTGETFSTNFPTMNGLSTPATNSNGSAFLTKIDPSMGGAASLLYSSYVGGTNGDFANAVAADASGNAYIGGLTLSSPGDPGTGGFPVTASAFQSTPDPSNNFGTGFLIRIDTTRVGNAGLIYSTYLGGNGTNNAFLSLGDSVLGVAVDTSSNAYLAGATASTNFPTMNGIQTSADGANTQGGGFMTRIDTTKNGANSLIYSTYLEGDTFDAALAIALGPNNVAYVTGTTDSLTGFPVTPGSFPTSPATSGVAFVTLVDATMDGANSVPYSTLFGGTGSDNGFGIAADGNGSAYVVGTTASGDFPITPNVIPRMIPNPAGTPFVLKLSPKGNGTADRIYASWFGGTGDATHDADQGNAIAIDSNGNAYIAGQMLSSNMPTTTGAFQTKIQGNSDAFVAKLPLLLPVVVSPASVDFGTQLVGATAAPQTITLTNNNSTALTINNIAIVAGTPPASATDFAIAAGGTCGANLPAGMSCMVNVTFTPSVASGESATLVFTDVDPSSPQSAALTGTGSANAPVIVLTPPNVNFGDQLVKTTSSPAQMITLKNNGNQTLNIMSIASSGDFAETNTCGATLSTGANCTISASFTPTATGARNGSVTITDDANGSPQTVPLTGTGTDFAVTAPASFTVKRRSSGMFNVTITPVSGFNQAVALTCTGAPTNSTCALNPTSVTPDGTNPITSQVTVTSMGSVPAVPTQITAPPTRQIVFFVSGLALLAMVFAARQRRIRLGLAGAMLLVFAAAGCGGNGGGQPVMGTLMITGTSGGVSHSTTVALTITPH